MPYGKSGSMSENGCGVITECEKGGTVLGGKLGTAPVYLEKYIEGKGYQVKSSYNIHEADKNADASLHRWCC